MSLPRVYEGTAEEIADQLRGSAMSGKLKAVISQQESPVESTPEFLDAALSDLLAEAEEVEIEIPPPHKDPYEIAFGEIITDKYKKMGFKL